MSRSLPAPLMYYRAYTRNTEAREKMLELAKSRIHTPTLYIHGQRDGCIGVELTAGQKRYFSGPFEQRIIDGAGHFVHLERPDEVAATISASLLR